MKKKESLQSISASIKQHTDQENQLHYPIKAVARFAATRTSKRLGTGTQIFWLVKEKAPNKPNVARDFTGTGAVAVSGTQANVKNSGESVTVFRDSILGGYLIREGCSKFSYQGPKQYGRRDTIEIDVNNRTQFSRRASEIIDLLIDYADKSSMKFKSLNDLNEQLSNKQKEIAKKQAEDKEKLRLLKEKKEADERAERERREQEKKYEAIIAKHEKELQEITELQKAQKAFLRRDAQLRSQHILDPSQEKAKRSHIYDGVPLLIDGGPGTGKTTTLIQRLKFLTSATALGKDPNMPDAPKIHKLTDAQVAKLTDENSVKNNWIFFSPTDLLCQYLRANMAEESLSVAPNNPITLYKFRNKAILDYGICDPTKNNFKEYKVKLKDEEPLVKMPSKFIEAFTDNCIDQIKATFKAAIELPTSKFYWHKYAMRIKSAMSNLKDDANILNILWVFRILAEDERKNIAEIEANQREILSRTTAQLVEWITADSSMTEELQELFRKWNLERQRRQTPVEPEDEDIEIDEEDEEELEKAAKQGFETQLFSVLRNLIKKVALHKIDSKFKLTQRDNLVLSIVKSGMDSIESMDKIGENAFFPRNMLHCAMEWKEISSIRFLQCIKPSANLYLHRRILMRF